MFQLVFNTEKIVAWCSKLFTLLPGDLILTGTPPGVGVFMKPPEFLKASSRGEEKSRVSLNVEIFFFRFYQNWFRNTMNVVVSERGRGGVFHRRNRYR